MSNPSIAADKTPWYQWDTGLTVTVSGGAMTECHFANRKQGTAYVQAVINGVARVPDELLQVAAPIKAYGYVSDGAGSQTYVEQSFEVVARNIPADYTYTKTAQKTIRDAEAARDEAVQAAKDAKASALAADDSAVEASKSAQSAGDSASAAATSASNAKKSSDEAATSASEAKAAAGKVVEDASELLKTYTDKAKTSADNAETSESNAADAASAASGSASAAERSATDASNAKEAAQTAKAEAEKAKDAAVTSASNAAESADSAAKSASDAATSVGAINAIAPKTVNTAAVSFESSVAVGSAAATNSHNSVAIGRRANITQNASNSVAIGQDAVASAAASVCIGINATAKYTNSIAIGANSTTSKSLEVSVGKPATDSRSEVVREITHVSTPTADTSASTKKYTDDNTTNALIDKVSGKLLHVEDALPSKPLGLAIDGAYKQDGTPSVENPVPITVIENPVLKVTGRNLQPYPFAFHHEKVETINGITFTDNGDGSVTASGTAEEAAFYNIDFASDAKFLRDVKVTASMSKYLNFSVECFGADGSIKPVTGNVTPPASFPSDAQLLRNYLYLPRGKTVNATVYPQFEYGDKATSYSPYVSKTLPITLPVDHPYLAALSDGTHDEIVIDKDGNVSLVARVGIDRDVREIESFIQGQYYNLKTTIKPFASQDASYSGGEMCSALPIRNKSVNGDGVYRTWTGVYVKDTSGRTREEIQAEIDKNAPLTIAVKIPETVYPLGKVTVPSLPDSISNVWTDAELATNMSMTYKRDVNVVIAGLNAKIEALKGTADEPPEITDPTIG